MSGSNQSLSNTCLLVTRKPCYRKDDRTMRPIYGCPEKNSGVPGYIHGYTFPEIVNLIGFCCDQSYESAYTKFEVHIALPVPKIIGGYLKTSGSPWTRPRSLFP